MHTDSIANTPGSRTATFEFDDFPVLGRHRAWGTPANPDYPWGATIYGENGTLKLSVMSYDFIPEGDGEPEHGDVVFTLDAYPEDRAPWVHPRSNTV